MLQKPAIFRLLMLFVFVFVCLQAALAQTAPAPTPTALPARRHAGYKNEHAGAFIDGHVVLSTFTPENGYHKGQPVVVVVDKGSHHTDVFQKQGDHVFRVFSTPNAIGKNSTPTPPGRYHVAIKKLDPEWLPTPSEHHKPVPPYSVTHQNPLGVAALFLNRPGILLHGTNQPYLLHHSVSHGCIRHSNRAIMTIFNMVHVGTPVFIVQHMHGTVLSESDFH